MISKRRDDKGRVLQQGEWQEPSGRYRYKYTDSLGKRKILYSWRLTEADKMPEGKRADLSLREKERKVQSLQMQGITGSNITVLELVERYLSLKTGVKHNTLANYKFVVNVLKKITILFQLNGITDFVISSFKRTEPTSTHCTHEMCQ